jgi:hypothetical protein
MIDFSMAMIRSLLNGSSLPVFALMPLYKSAEVRLGKDLSFPVSRRKPNVPILSNIIAAQTAYRT